MFMNECIQHQETTYEQAFPSARELLGLFLEKF